VTVRAAGPADAERIADFSRRLALESEGIVLDPARVAEGVRLGLETTARARYWMAEDGGEVVGQCMVTTEWSDWRAGWMWWLQSVYVTPEARGRGVFRALWERVLADARAAGDVVGIRLYVHDENDDARAIYERVGMERSPYLVYELPLVEAVRR
jgi:GNAT superfamily N-acetyltransferase